MEGGERRGPETSRTGIHIHLNIGTDSRVQIADALGKELHHPKTSKLWYSKTGPTDRQTILFGEDTSIVKFQNIFHKNLKKNYLAIGIRIVEDTAYATKVLYAADIRVQRWLEKCMDVTDRCDVDDHIINFDNILNSVLNCQFITNIPPAFTMAEKKQDRPGTGDTTSLTGGDRAGKRRKTSED